MVNLITGGAGFIGSTLYSRGSVCLLAIPECVSLQKLADIARPDDRILVASYYPYWLKPSQLQCRDTLEEQRDIPDQEKLLSWLRYQGFKYVIIDKSVAIKLSIDMQRLSESDVAEVSELHQGGTLAIFSIRADTTARVQCIASGNGRWRLQRDVL